MSIWYLHHYAGHPKVGMSYRPYYLARAMKDLHQEMVVFSASFHHLKINECSQKDRIVLEYVDGIPYCWIKTRAYSGNGFGRIINMFQFAFILLLINPVKQLGLTKPRHIIVSSAHPFHILAGWLYAKRYKASLSFEIRDIWPLSIIELLGISRFHPLCVLIKIFEKFAFIVSDRIISVLPNAWPYLERNGVKPNDFFYLPNGTLEVDDSESYALKEEDDLVLKAMEKIIDSYPKVIFYGGGHGVPNNLELLIEAMRYVPSKYALVLVGDGQLKPKLKALAQSYKLRNVFFLDKVSKSAIMLLIRMSEICIISAHKTPLYQYGVSMNKLFDYMLESKPVLFAIDSPNSVIEKSKCGIVLASENAIDVAEGIKDMLELPDENLLNMGERGRDFVLKNHLFSVLARKLLNELNKIEFKGG
ncbi:glycosyltransferase family 4 protein [Amphritea sp. 1_MG-2023]|uniref:glycosyltransferase family 4 protein n=1 Tax=Amphritea sp. 1_MG-2023 TaxID=3062670 RepID=UPI0026E39A6C|nr:glycosyltransferase family 4 protein [Amphritea sp. 1_MG-2023]MDO6563993.1 glycosyltransferase family 4 protein [Amphritea sp. 1_MG-2023]